MAPRVFRRFREEGQGELGFLFKLGQLVVRVLAVVFELGTLAVLAWAYDKWRSDPSVRVDLFFPCFFPVIVAILGDGYESVSLAFLRRERPINPVIVLCDVAVAAVGVFCFVTISASGYEVYRGVTGLLVGTNRPLWAEDVNSVMICMMVFSLLHALFILVAAIAGVYLVILKKRTESDERVARNQAEMIHFNERQKKRWAARGWAV